MAVQATKISFTTEDNFPKIRNKNDIADVVNTEKYTYVKKFRVPLLGINIWRRTERILADDENI